MSAPTPGPDSGPGGPGGPGSGFGAGDRYAREGRIATGGMGEVWRARDTVLGREVAVKVLKQEYADDPTFRARFDAEARHAAGLHHPGIASVFDYGVPEGGGAPYLVMELVDGKPLSDLLADGRPFDPEQARGLLAQAADALAVAHAAGVVHRDVKPGNLMVTPDGRVKITDFGIARAADSVPITTTGQIVGTPHYLSPEQARGNAATAASDVYALGVVLFECLAGHRPFTADSPVATALAHLQQEVPPLPADVPPDLAAVVRRALAKDPADRYADGGAIAAALRNRDEGTAQVPAPTPPPPAAETSVLPAAAPLASRTVETTTEPVEPPSRSRSRWPLYALLGLIALLLLVVLLLTRPWEGEDAADPDTPTPSGRATTRDSASPTASASDSPSPSASDSPSESPSSSGSPSDSPSGSPSSSPSDSPSPSQTAGQAVQVDEDTYVGRPVAAVERALDGLGLTTTRQAKDNPGEEAEGTVAGLSPTGKVDPGARITLQVWGPPASTGPGNGNGNGRGNGNGQGNGRVKPGPGNGGEGD